jgi:hypothetical protein
VKDGENQHNKDARRREHNLQNPFEVNISRGRNRVGVSLHSPKDGKDIQFPKRCLFWSLADYASCREIMDLLLVTSPMYFCLFYFCFRWYLISIIVDADSVLYL